MVLTPSPKHPSFLPAPALAFVISICINNANPFINSNDQGVTIYRGLRIRMGVHYGEPVCEQDHLSARIEYYGPVVNVAARIAAFAAGGQILMSTEVYARCMNGVAKVEPCVVDPLGNCQVKGLHDAMLLYQVCFFTSSWNGAVCYYECALLYY